MLEDLIQSARDEDRADWDPVSEEITYERIKTTWTREDGSWPASDVVLPEAQPRPVAPTPARSGRVWLIVLAIGALVAAFLFARAQLPGAEDTAASVESSEQGAKHLADARAAYSRGNTAQAEELANLATKEGPEEAARAHALLAEIETDRGDHAAAARQFERAAAADPEAANLEDLLFRAYDAWDASGQTHERDAAARRYLESYPDGRYASRMTAPD